MADAEQQQLEDIKQKPVAEFVQTKHCKMPTGVDPEVFENLLANLNQLNSLCNDEQTTRNAAMNAELEEFKSHEMLVQ